MSKEAMQMALDALRRAKNRIQGLSSAIFTEANKDECAYIDKADAALQAALQAALAEQPALTDAEIHGAVARGWCSKENAHKEMDATLAIAISREVKAILAAAIPPGWAVVPTTTEKCPACADGVLARHLCLRCVKCNIELYGDPEGKFNLAARPGAPR